MVGQIARWIVWLLIASFAVSYAPILLRLDREALATVGVFALCVISVVLVGRLVYSRGRGDGEEQDEFLLWRQNADRFRD